MKIHRKENLLVQALTLTGLNSHLALVFYEVVKMKKCSKCGKEKSLDYFHVNKNMKDGRLGACKHCCNSLNKERDALPKRIKSRAEYKLTPRGKEAQSRARDKYHKAFPKQKKARARLELEIKKGDMVRPDNCSFCKFPCKPEAHHSDYDKPLEVIFLCMKCHKAWHRNNTPLNKG